jgi:homoserine acetyltransferase
MIKKKLSLILVPFMIFAFTSCTDTNKTDSDTAQKQIHKVAVEAYTLKEENIPLWMNFTGKTKASKNIDVVARVKGVLKKQYFHAGDIVKKGDMLFFPEEMKEIKREMDKLGKFCNYFEIDSDYGHDSFLVEVDKFENIVREILK